MRQRLDLSLSFRNRRHHGMQVRVVRGVCAHAREYTLVCVCVCLCVSLRVCTYTHTHTNTHMCIHTYVYT
jgi:hypothetical protein